MMKKYKTSLFIFRRDLRIIDNTGLIGALEQSKQVITCFIFDPAQISDTNIYRSDRAVTFMVQAIHDLEKQIKTKNGRLHIFYGTPSRVVEKLLVQNKIEALFLNKDYTPYSLKRDQEIELICNKAKVSFHSFNDILLHEPEKTLKKNKTPYLIFTPFYNYASQLPVSRPIQNNNENYFSDSVMYHSDENNKSQLALIKKQYKKQLAISADRKSVENILHNIQNFKDYKKFKDFPAFETTGLSAYLKFGICSIREAYYAINDQLGNRHELIRQLYWRDFFTYIAYFFPKVFGHPFREKYSNMDWNTNREIFNKWCNGMTGYPIIDAGMRQLNQTGFMHNRVRLLTASFLIKDLNINWTWGEQYFAQKLIDYDPAVNNGNWQWVASTGADAQPYFRIFNPWLQQKKFDPECLYIKKWVPELSTTTIKNIHNWFACHTTDTGYPAPIVDHAKESDRAKKKYTKII